MIVLKWDIRFLEMANLVASWSKDPSTKIGSVAVDASRRVLSMGYNGFPTNFSDDNRLANKPIKYDLIIHSEMNCVFNAAHNGISLKDSTIYVSGLPVCHNCMKGLIQCGVKRFVMDLPPLPLSDKWRESTLKTIEMVDEIRRPLHLDDVFIFIDRNEKKYISYYSIS